MSDEGPDGHSVFARKEGISAYEQFVSNMSRGIMKDLALAMIGMSM